MCRQVIFGSDVTLPESEPAIDRRRLIRRSLVVFGLMTAGIAAPVLDLYGRNPAVFVANRSTPMQIVIFGLLVTFIPPLLAVMILFVTERVGGKTADIAYLTLVGISAAATGMAISRQVLPDTTVGALLFGLGFAAFVVLVCRRVEQGLAYFSLLGPAVLVMFFVISPTSRLLAEPEENVAGTEHIGRPAPIVLIQLDELPLASLMDEDGGAIADFGDGGHILSDLGGPADAWYGVAVSPDGAYAIVAGYKGVAADSGGNDDAVIARIRL